MRVCQCLSEALGVPIVLRDRDLRVISSGDDDQGWVVSQTPTTPAGVASPVVVRGETIGWIDAGLAQDQSGHPVACSINYLARTVGELCTRELELSHRVGEIQSLFRLSAALVGVSTMDETLDLALNSALEALDLDAGSVGVFQQPQDLTAEKETGVLHRATHGLSEAWTGNPWPLSKHRLFDRMMADGEVVISEDLASDDRVLSHEATSRDGLACFIGVGLLFRGRMVGVFRLYGRQKRTFSEGECRLLKSIAQQAAVAVAQANLLRVEREDRQTRRQLQLAVDVQRRMLPARTPSLSPLDVTGRYQPSLQLGGDFYDLFEIESQLAMTVGDVVGKGVGAALLMSLVRGSLRATTHELLCDVATVMMRVNEAMCRDSQPNEFATVWYGICDPATLTLSYCSAGHEPPFVVRAGASGQLDESCAFELELGGLVLGVDQKQSYVARSQTLEPGDVLIAYTDGLTDTMNFQDEKFGKKRIVTSVIDALNLDPDASADNIIERVFWHLRQFSGLRDKIDDQTLIIMRVQPGK